MSRENIRLVKPAPPPVVHPDHVVCLCPNCRLVPTLPAIFSVRVRRKRLPDESGKGGLRRVGHFVARLDQLPIMESLEVQLEP